MLPALSKGTATYPLKITSDTSLVLLNVWLKSVRRVLERTAIFAISSLYLAMTMLGTTACAKNSSSVVMTVRKGGLL